MAKAQNCLTGIIEDFEDLPQIANIPAFNGVTEAPKSDDIFYNLDFQISRSNGLIQLKHLPDLSLVYQQQTTSKVTGELWKSHHEKFSQFLSKYNVKNVIEFGGAHGYLAQITKSKYDITSWTIVDPIPAVEGDFPLSIKGFFDPVVHIKDETDAIVSSHAIEHLTSPWQILEKVYQCSSNQSLFICSIPNLNAWLEKCQPNSLNFEHTYLLGESHFEKLMSSIGYLIIEKQYFATDHSIFYCFRKNGQFNKDSACVLDNRYEINFQLFANYCGHYPKVVEKLISNISEIKYDELYLFGAHLFSQFIVSNGLCSELQVAGILDNNEDKHNKRLYGSNLMCKSPNVIKNSKQPLVVVKAGGYTDEICKQLLSINPNCKLIK